jgi:hypothetical protein
VILAVLAAALFAAVLAWSCTLSPKVAPVTATLGGVGALLLLLVLVRGVDDLLGSALLLVGGAYVLGLYASRRSLDETVPLVAAALLLCGELATWSLEVRQPVRGEPGLVLARARAVGMLALSGLAVSALVVIVSGTTAGGGLAWALAGAAAAVVVVALSARLASR